MSSRLKMPVHFQPAEFLVPTQIYKYLAATRLLPYRSVTLHCKLPDYAHRFHGYA